MNFHWSGGACIIVGCLVAVPVPTLGQSASSAASFGTTVINGKVYHLPPPPVNSGEGAALIIPDSPEGPIKSPPIEGPPANPAAPETGPLPQPKGYFTLGNQQYASDEIFVRFSPAASTSSRQNLLVKYRLQALFHLKAADTYVMSVPPDVNPPGLVTALNAEPGIHDAALDGTQQACYTPNDPFFTQGAQWWLGAPSGGHHDDMPSAWGRTLGSSNFFISVLDSGIDFTHPDLQPKLLPNGSGGYFWYNETNYGVLPQDSGAPGYFPHGTFVSGIAAAATNNGLGIAGVCPNSEIIPVKVFIQYSNGMNMIPSFQALYQGIIDGYQVSLGARVLNFSGGGTSTDPSIEQAITRATDDNALFVSTTANTGDSTTYFPGAYWNVMAVGASNYTDQPQEYSAYGPQLSVLAPSGDGPHTGMVNEILSTYAPSTYGTGYGTSFAAPQVSGLAALLASRYTTMTSYDLRYRIEDTADNIDHVMSNGSDYRDYSMGWGRINANRATQASQVLSYNINSPSLYGFSIPAWPTNISLSNPGDGSQDLPTLFPGVTASAYWWDPKAANGSGGYISYSNADYYSPSGDGLVVPRFGPGRGYEVSTSAATSFYSASVSYPFTKPNHKAVCHLFHGWNLIGTPNYQAITWNTSTFRVRRPNTSNNSQVVVGNDGSPYDEPLSQAAAEGIIDDHAMSFDRTHVIQQNPAPGVYTQIQPLNAYWIYVYSKDDLDLLVPAA